MSNELMRLMSQFALVGVILYIATQAYPGKSAIPAPPTPTNAAGPALIYDAYTV